MYLQALALLTFVVLSGSLGSCSLCGKQNFWSTVTLLDQYHDGTTSEVPPFETLQRAYNEFNVCLPENKKKMMEKDPRVSLLNDFLINPMKRFLRDEHMNEPEAEEAFANRLATHYCRFKPLYLRDEDAVDYFITTRKTSLLLSSLEKSKGNDVTVKMLLDAKKEYDMLKAKLKETLTYEDVYAEHENIASMMKYFARDRVKVLEEHLFPRINKDMQLTSDLKEELYDLYKAGLIKKGYTFS